MWEFFQTKGNKRQGRLYLVPTSESIVSRSQLARLRESLRSCLLLQGLLRRVPSAALGKRVDWMTVEAAVSAALGKLRAARLPLQRCFGAREATYTRRKDFKLSSSSIFLQRCLRRPGEHFDAADA